MNLQTLRLDNGEAASSEMGLSETRPTWEDANLTADIVSEIQS